MSQRRINPHLVKLHRSYATGEAARVLGVHKNTIHSWIKAGLPTVDNARPVLLLGSELKAWLGTRCKSAKRPLGSGKFYCFKCREPKAPAFGEVEYKPMNNTSGMLIALCADCTTLMHRRCSKDKIHISMPNLNVQITKA